MKVVIASLNPAIERLLVVERNEPGSVHRLRRSETLAGGKGVNVARVLRQLGTPEFRLGEPPDTDAVAPILVGPLGGPTGRLQAELLAAEGLDSQTVTICAWTRTNEVLIDESAPEMASVYNAAGPDLNTGELARIEEAASSALADAAFLVCTGSIPPGIPSSFYRSWIHAARRCGIPTLLDAHGEALAAGAGTAPTVIKVNRDELVELADNSSTTPDQLVAAWIRAGTRAAIITDGSAPAIAYTKTRQFEVRPPRVKTLSGVGSGDAFSAGLVWSMLAEPDAGWVRHLSVAAACGASNAASVLARLASDCTPGALLGDVSIREGAGGR